MARTFLLVFAMAGVLAPRPARAQDSTSQGAAPPPPKILARKCTKWRSEGIVVLGADARGAGPAAPAYFAQLAKLMERRLTHQLPDSTVLVATFAAQIARAGEVNKIRLVKGSEHEGFDLDAQRAASFSAGDPDLLPMPAGIPDSLSVFLVFGRNEDGSDYMLTHVSCEATLLPGNPPPEYPVAATISRSRYRAHVRYTVGVLGTIDTAGVVFLEETPEAFGIATLEYLNTLHFIPADFDGERRTEDITETILFLPPGAEPSATP